MEYNLEYLVSTKNILSSLSKASEGDVLMVLFHEVIICLKIVRIKIPFLLQVFRIMIVMKEAVADSKQPPGPSAPPSGQVPIADAYAILGVTSSSTPAEVKKKYMRLSLLIHPGNQG